jgi:cytoskeletal protein CcmA (bactofilin family)
LNTLRFVVLLLVISGLAISFSACEPGSESHKKGPMKTVILPAGEVHDGWYFAGGDHVIIDGTVNGDVYAGAGKVEINGTVNGDVLAAGGAVEIGGYVSDDIRAAGGTVRITGVVGKNVSVAGGTVEIARSASIGGGLLAAGGTIQQAGTVKKDAMLGSGTTEITGTIDGNVDVASDQLGIHRGAQIGGNVTATVKEKDNVRIAEGSVKGTVTFKEREAKEVRRILGFTPWRFWLKILWIGGLLVTGLVLFLVSRKLFTDFGSRLTRTFGMNFVWGFVVLIAIPIIFIILCVTVVGIPLGGILLAAYFVAIYFSQLSLGLLAGNLLFKTEGKSEWRAFGAFAVGTVLFQILTFIPILGGVLEFAALLLGLGAIVLMIRGAYSRPVVAPSQSA